MIDVLSIPLDQIHTPEDYVRPLDEGAAQRLARMIDREGQKAPIAVYRSTARQGGEKPYTLIYGARRLRAMAILGRSEIESVLRTKAEALMLSIADNFAMTTLDALEQGEHVALFAEWWAETNGPISHGGDRRSRFHGETLKRKMDFLEKSSFYKDLSEKFGISKSTGWRLLKIGNMHPALRAAIRGTSYAKDQTHLRKLVKYDPNKQEGIAAALRIEPDLDVVLRLADPVTGREAVGRMDTQDWREKQFLDGWTGMTPERRAAALEQIGAIAKPLAPWPTHFSRPPARQAPGNVSPLWKALRDPMGLVRYPTYEQIEAAKAEYEAEALEAQWAATMAIRINAAEQERREGYERQRTKAKAARSRKPKRGRPPDPPHVKREKAFRKWFIPELASTLLDREEVDMQHWALKYCRKLDAEEQFRVSCHLANGHSVDDIPWRVERDREDEASK